MKILPYFITFLLVFYPTLNQAKEVISVYTTNGSTVHVNQNFRHGQRIEVPLGKLTDDPTREGVIQINSLLNFNHHVAIGDGDGGGVGGSGGLTGKNSIDDGSGNRNAKKIGNGKQGISDKNSLGGSSSEIEEPLPEYCKDKEQIHRFANVVAKIPHDDCPNNLDSKLLEGINRRRACARMAPLTLSAALSAEAATEVVFKVTHFKTFKTKRNVGFYARSWWNNYGKRSVNAPYFNLLADFDDNYHQRPFLQAVNRYYSAKEWANTRQVGIACAGRNARNGVYTKGTQILALFELPENKTDPHTPEDGDEDKDGDGVADPKRLPPYCAHEDEKLREIDSSISVPVTVCPKDVLDQAIEGFSHQRVCSGLPQLIHTSDMAALATKWANNQTTNGLWYQPNMPDAGQYTIGKEAPISTTAIDLRDLDIFSKWDDWNGLPWYVPGSGQKDRYFTPEEWARTREFGVGCATYSYEGKKNHFWLVAYFKHPGKQTLPGYCTDNSLKMSVSATVTVPQKGCPPEISKAAVDGFQKRRTCQGLAPMAYSEAAAVDAAKWAADISVGDGYIRRYQPYGQFTSNSRAEWEKSSGQIVIKDFDIFEKWASWKQLPWYTGASSGDRYFSEKEWADTKEFGVGCASLTRNGKSYFFQVAFFKYPN